MSYEVLTIPPFEREATKLSRKYPTLKKDLAQLVESLENNPKQGVSLGQNFYKIRLSITSKGRGKSGGARVISFVIMVEQKVFLAAIYDKSEQDTIEDQELKILAQLIAEKNK